jgi:hypothetical protein
MGLKALYFLGDRRPTIETPVGNGHMSTRFPENFGQVKEAERRIEEPVLF